MFLLFISLWIIFGDVTQSVVCRTPGGTTMERGFRGLETVSLNWGHERSWRHDLLGSEGPTVRNRTVRNRIFSQISPSTCARRWIGHQKLNSAAIMREIMAGMWDFPCFGPVSIHLSRNKRAPIAGGHNAGNTDASGGAAVACRVREQPAVPTEPDEKSLPVTVLVSEPGL
jgi:hypothetical protein